MTPAHTPARLPASVWFLALALGIGMSGATIAVRVAAVFGAELSGDQALSTLPTALQFFGVMLGGILFSNAMARFGRKRVLLVGLLFGIAAGLIGVATALARTYWSLFPTHFCLGLFLACIALLRFTAADQVDGPLSARALSLTLFGGVIAAFVGPGLVFISAQVSVEQLYLLSYACIAVVSALVWILIALTTIRERAPDQTPVQTGETSADFITYPYLTAVLTGAVGYGIMSMLMTAAALHMSAMNMGGAHAGHYGENVLTFAIMWHVVAMFAPMVIMAPLADWLGLKRLMILGAVLLAAAAALGASDQSPPAMFIALILLGFGWAGTYGAAGIMIKQVVSDGARFRAQGRNEMLVSLLSGLGAVSAGPLLKAIDWQAMNLIALFLALWLLPLIALNRRARIGIGMGASIHLPIGLSAPKYAPMKRPLLSRLFTFLTLCLPTLSGLPAHGEGWTLGLVSISGPNLAGQDETLLAPLIFYTAGAWTLGGQGIVRFDWGNADGGWHGDLGLGLDAGQDSPGAPSLDGAVTLDAAVNYRFPYFILGAQASRRFADDGAALLSPSISTGYPVAENALLIASLGADYGTAGHRQAFYGLDSAGMTARSLTIGTLWNPLEKITVLVNLTQRDFVDDIANLSFVDSATQTQGIVGVSYSF